jgi:hypothetical protein
MRWKADEPLIEEYKENPDKSRFVHVWGGISKHGKTSLYIHEKSVNSEEYIKYL